MGVSESQLNTQLRIPQQEIRSKRKGESLGTNVKVEDMFVV